MASRIAALKAQLGGPALIMGGMRGGLPPSLKKKRQTPRGIDNSMILQRTTVNEGNRKNRKKRTINVNFDELETDEKSNYSSFTHSISTESKEYEMDIKTESNDNEYDEDIVLQLMQFGYDRQAIINASKQAIDYKDINAIQQILESNLSINSGSNIFLLQYIQIMDVYNI